MAGENEPQASRLPTRVLTIRQPYAHLIRNGIKRFETRKRPLSESLAEKLRREPVAIHAAAGWTNGQANSARKLLGQLAGLLELRLPGSPGRVPEVCELTLGAIVAVVIFDGCELITPELIAKQTRAELFCGDWEPGRYAWRIREVRVVVPAVQGWTGKQGWRALPAELAEQVAANALGVAHVH